MRTLRSADEHQCVQRYVYARRDLPWLKGIELFAWLHFSYSPAAEGMSVLEREIEYYPQGSLVAMVRAAGRSVEHFGARKVIRIMQALH